MFDLSEEYVKKKDKLTEDYKTFLELLGKLSRKEYVENDVKKTAAAYIAVEKSKEEFLKISNTTLSTSEILGRENILGKLYEKRDVMLRFIDDFDKRREGHKGITDYHKDMLEAEAQAQQAAENMPSESVSERIERSKIKLSELDNYISHLEDEIGEIDKGIAERDVKIEENRTLVRELSESIDKMQMT